MITEQEEKKVREELAEVNTKIEEINKVYYPKKRELEGLLNKKSAEERKIDFEKNYIGKMFYGDISTWSGYENTMYLAKPLSCEDYSHQYHSCKALVLRIETRQRNKGLHSREIDTEYKFFTLKIETESMRADLFSTHYRPLTSEKLLEFKTKLGDVLLNTYLNFNLEG